MRAGSGVRRCSQCWMPPVHHGVIGWDGKLRSGFLFQDKVLLKYFQVAVPVTHCKYTSLFTVIYCAAQEVTENYREQLKFPKKDEKQVFFPTSGKVDITDRVFCDTSGCTALKHFIQSVFATVIVLCLGIVEGDSRSTNYGLGHVL